jgi:polysaccharide biosynthesis transport protein
MSRTAPSTEPPTPTEAPFGVADFLRVLGERRVLIRNVTLAVVALTALVVMSLPTLYSTTAVVMLDQRKNSVADLSAVLSALPTDPSSVQNQIQVLSSRDLALKVIARLKLYADPEFNPALGNAGVSLNLLSYFKPAAPPPNIRDAIVNNFLSRLDVSALGLSTSIDVTFTARDPGKAALIANTLAESYTQDQVAVKIGAARQAALWLSERMHQLALEVQQQESAVEQYKAAHNLVESAQGDSLVDQQLMAINTQLVQAQSDLAEKKASYERVAALAKTGNAADVTPVVNSKMIGDLRTQEAELVRQESDLTSRYGPNHPKIVAIHNEKRDLENKIAHEVASVAGSMQSDLEVARAHVGSINASLARVEKQARDDNMARIKLNALESNLASTRTIYESFVGRLRAVQDQDDIQIPEARVISTAPVPSSPSSPHRMLFIAASLPAGLFLGILAALLAERFQAPAPRQDFPPHRDFRVEPAPVRQAAPAPDPVLPPVLAELQASADLRLADWVVDNPASAYGQSLTAVLRALSPARSGQARVVALTSPAADFGKSVIALGLARLASRYGLRTILIDGDLGRTAPPGGLAALMSGAPLASVLVRDRRSNAFLLSSQPSAWAFPHMAELFGHLRQNCDFILVDAAPVGTPGPWPVLAGLCDSVILVGAAASPLAVFDLALRSLVATRATVSGLLVTR